MEQQEMIDYLIARAQTKTLKRDLQIISDKLYEEIDHHILIELLFLIVENEKKIINLIK
tara:strand:- start:205 stop:381 length:177 start_codon:yes stop_codon:yes gene_type:complete